MNESYFIGLQAMDDEHKTLFGLIGALSMKRENADTKFVQNILATLEHYTKSHFVHEERMMARMNYRGLEDHKRQHRNFVAKLRSIDKAIEAGSDIDLILAQTLDFLREWLLKHIASEDKAYVQFLTE